MPDLEHQAEIDAYYLADPAHQRAAGLMWPAIVERRINKLFEAALRKDPVLQKELFRPSGPLGTYGVKVRLSYMFGWFGKDVFDDLILIGKIRNRFAHAIEAKDFSDQQIATWLRNMNAFRILPPMLDRAKQQAKDDPKAPALAKVLILEHALEGDHMGFRWCISQMIHQLDRCHTNMVKNLSALPGNWMVADEKK